MFLQRWQMHLSVSQSIEYQFIDDLNPHSNHIVMPRKTFIKFL